MTIKKVALGIAIFAMTANGIASAAPERLEIKSQEAKEKHRQAQAIAATVDLSRIEDPEVRQALRALFQAVNLETRK